MSRDYWVFFAEFPLHTLKGWYNHHKKPLFPENYTKYFYTVLYFLHRRNWIFKSQKILVVYLRRLPTEKKAKGKVWKEDAKSLGKHSRVLKVREREKSRLISCPPLLLQQQQALQNYPLGGGHRCYCGAAEAVLLHGHNGKSPFA